MEKDPEIDVIDDEKVILTDSGRTKCSETDE